MFLDTFGGEGESLFAATYRGIFSLSDPAASMGAALPASALMNSTLRQNYPNPFNPETVIPYAIASPSEVTLAIYNVRGDLVRMLLDHDRHAAGDYTARWDGRDQQGHLVSGGVYFYTIRTEAFCFTKRMILLR